MRRLRRAAQRARSDGSAIAAGLAVWLAVLLGAPAAPAKDLVDILSETPVFSTLLELLEAAEMKERLRLPGPYTLLAPTDRAFAMLPPDALAALVQPENRAQLLATINRHLLAGRFLARDQAGRRRMVPTLDGGWLTMDGTRGSLMIDDDVEVLHADIVADNGVIHVIDSVVLRRAPAGDIDRDAF